MRTTPPEFDHPRRSPTKHGARAITIVEAAVSVVIVAVLLVAALRTLGAAARARVVQSAQAQGPSLARLLLAEIRATRYADPEMPDGPLGPEAGESAVKDRTGFDDVDDFNGFTESPPRARDGSPLPNLSAWRRDVAVEWVQPDQPDTVVNTDLGLKRITVTVTGNGVTARLVALRSRYGTYDQLPRQRTTYVAGAGVELKTGSDARHFSGTNLSNQVVTP
jgi:type II secretory pathway pseudopilin PulG